MEPIVGCVYELVDVETKRWLSQKKKKNYFNFHLDGEKKTSGVKNIDTFNFCGKCNSMSGTWAINNDLTTCAVMTLNKTAFTYWILFIFMNAAFYLLNLWMQLQAKHCNGTITLGRVLGWNFFFLSNYLNGLINKMQLLLENEDTICFEVSFRLFED